MQLLLKNMFFRAFMLIIFLTAILPRGVCAFAEPPKNEFSWSHLGLGGIIEDQGGVVGIGFLLMLNYTIKNQSHSYSLRALSGALLYTPDEVNEFGFLFNKIFEPEWDGFLKGNNMLVSLGFGASVVTGKKRGAYIGPPDLDNASSPSDFESSPFTTVGVPIEMQVFIFPSNFDFGLDLIGYANINPIQSFWGICLCPRFGKASIAR